MKKHFVGLTTLCLALMMGVSSVNAFTPPGLAQKDGLPPGIQKKLTTETEDIKYLREILDMLKKKGIKDLKELLNIIEKKETKEYRTTIKDIDVKERRIYIQDGTAVLSLLVDSKTKIQLNGKASKIEDLRKNDEIYIKLDKNNTVVELEATRKKELGYIVEGKLLLVDENNNKIYIHEGSKVGTYQLKSDVNVLINGQKTRISNLTSGMDLKLTIEGDKVKLIEGTKDLQTKINGTIIGIDYNRLEIVLQEGTKTTLYKAKSTTPIKIDDKTNTFKGLVVGMELEAYVIDQNIVSISGKSLAIQTQKGIVKSINVDRKEIVLTQDSKETLFKINANASVKINDVVKTLSDIAVNVEAQLTIRNGEVIEIRINQLIQSYEGRILAKDMGTKPSITVQIGNEVKVFLVKSDLNIVGIEVGKEAIIHVKDNQVIAIAIK